MQIDFLQSVVDRRTGNQVVLLGEVDPRETVKTSFWTPAFFRSWSVWMGVVLLDHCQGDQNNFCLSSLFGWGLLYRTRAFARGYLGVLLLHLSYLRSQRPPGALCHFTGVRLRAGRSWSLFWPRDTRELSNCISVLPLLIWVWLVISGPYRQLKTVVCRG